MPKVVAFIGEGNPFAEYEIGQRVILSEDDSDGEIECTVAEFGMIVSYDHGGSKALSLDGRFEISGRVGWSHRPVSLDELSDDALFDEMRKRGLHE